MTNYQKVYAGISKTAWGYFFVYFDFKINNISLLPSFVGYLLFLTAINYLKDEERELSLLRTMGTILALWHGMEWIASWVNFDFDGAWQFADIIICIVNLYFHFQLLTNFASIAKKYQPEGYTYDAKLLLCRTIQTITLTVIEIILCFYPLLSEMWVVITFFMFVVFIFMGVCLMKVLFNLRNCLSNNIERQQVIH